MTAEIAIINRSGIALAADSAVTIGRDRVWKNSNKLFHLSPRADIGVMVFGNGSYCGLPWEVVIKQYRKKIGHKTFDHLSDYTRNFLEFLDELSTPHPLQNDLNTFMIMLNNIEHVKPILEKVKGKTSKRKSFIAEMAKISSRSEERPIIFEDFSREQFSQKHSTDIRSFLEGELDILVTKPVLSAMITACYQQSVRAVESGAETGVFLLALETQNSCR